MPDDRDLIQIVDAAVADAAQRAGSWLLCRAGCAQCCVGPFEIGPMDVARLREGLRELRAADPLRAEQVIARAQAFVALDETAADEEPCPALNRETLTCEVYASRPLTCRLFGPPVRSEANAFVVCELCFDGATEEEIAACEVHLESSILDDDGAPSTVAETLAEV